jgi:hypothetical protein
VSGEQGVRVFLMRPGIQEGLAGRAQTDRRTRRYLGSDPLSAFRFQELFEAAILEPVEEMVEIDRVSSMAEARQEPPEPATTSTNQCYDEC